MPYPTLDLVAGRIQTEFNDPALPGITAAAQAYIDGLRFVDSFPEAVRNEAYMRFVGYLFDAPEASAGASYANAWRNCGAEALVAPWRRRGAAVIGEAQASTTGATAAPAPAPTVSAFVPTKQNLFDAVKAIFQPDTQDSVTADDGNNELDIIAAAPAPATTVTIIELVAFLADSSGAQVGDAREVPSVTGNFLVALRTTRAARRVGFIVPEGRTLTAVYDTFTGSDITAEFAVDPSNPRRYVITTDDRRPDAHNLDIWTDGPAPTGGTGTAPVPATMSVPGVVEYATQAEIDAEDDPAAGSRVANLAGVYRTISRRVKAASKIVAGIVEYASNAEIDAEANPVEGARVMDVPGVYRAITRKLTGETVKSLLEGLAGNVRLDASAIQVLRFPV